MQPERLESAAAKINRAKHHLRQLDSDIQRDRTSQLYGIAYKRDPQTNEWIISALLPSEPFIQYSILAGEVVSQARSALEHAVWEMVPSPIDGTTGFPVYRFEVHPQKRHYQRDGLAKINGINTKAEAIIRAEQPFGPNHTANQLWLLTELWNRDKHRLLNSCVHYLQGIQLMCVIPGQSIDRHIPVPEDVKDGAELARLPANAVKVQAEVAMSEVKFNDWPVKGKEAPELLTKLVQFAERVVADLRGTIT